MRTPTSEVPVIKLLAMRVWYRSLTIIRKYCSGRASPRTSAKHTSPASRLPLEIVEMIIAHLVYNRLTLLACSLTCRSWYTAAVPHIHHTLTITFPCLVEGGTRWSRALLYMHHFRLLPLVKKFRISSHACGKVSPNQLNPFFLPRFFALTNVRELEIANLNVPSFIPSVRRCFKNVLPTLRSLTLRTPDGSPRQILYFVGQFQHLEDLTLFFRLKDRFLEEPAKNLTLVPPFTPPLRGWLRVRFLTGVLFPKTMIDLFGGIRSCHMDLYCVDGMSLLLGACAGRLETLRLYLNDPRTRSCLWDSGLSRHKSLQTIEVVAWTIDEFLNGRSADSASRLFQHALSTITSPSFLEVVIRYRNRDFCGILGPFDDPIFGLFVRASQAERDNKALQYRRHLKAFRGCQKVRDFQLVLCAAVVDGVGEYSVRVLKNAVATEMARGALEDFISEPVVIHSPRSAVSHDLDELSTFFFTDWRFSKNPKWT